MEIYIDMLALTLPFPVVLRYLKCLIEDFALSDAEDKLPGRWEVGANWNSFICE